MVQAYRIRPLLQAYISAPMGVAFYLGDMRTLVTTGVFIWYIEGAEKKILIDAGMDAPGPNGLVHGFPAKGGGEKGTLEALSSIGLKPKDIDTLIITHLHFDHTATLSLFDNARIYVQKKEWDFAHNPVPSSKATYDPKPIDTLDGMDLALIDGEYELLPGIRLIPLPGHTKGLQGVAVETTKGTYLIGSDHFYTYFNIKPPRQPIEFTDLAGNKITLQPSPLPFLPIGLHVDLSDWFESSYKALSITKRDMIIPGHDPGIVGKSFP
ncbi:N-acyl homoserine lactonase family protein [Caldisphaera sp.]|jgi:glyoxylase-like metal-dependent hydrolase (beta-lactamase superfamily II)|uniref:N-acyl homoserine lactonase family protein n=1 Tax=Caldisphaera sp. TaxID=2060322 RepID=UPI003D0AEC89